MLLDHRFYRLPLNIDAQRIQDELSKIPESEWINHPNSNKGNSTLPLISINGEDNHDVIGEMQMCPRLEKMPYVKYVLSRLNTNLGRSRFMRLEAGAGVPSHCDTNLYWLQRMRIHIPITTNPSVVFKSGNQTRHMASGESWVLDTWHKHSVANDGDERIHLVADTHGTDVFWSMLNTLSWRPQTNDTKPPTSFKVEDIRLPTTAKLSVCPLPLETGEYEVVLTPDKVDNIIDFYFSDLVIFENSEPLKSTKTILNNLVKNWRTIWDIYGYDESHHLRYQMVVLHAIRQLNALQDPPHSKTNEQPLSTLLMQLVGNLREQKISKQRIKSNSQPIDYLNLHFSPVFIVAAPRSGSTLLYETLGCHETLMHYGAESHNLIESIPALSVEANDSNALDAQHVSTEITNTVKQQFLQQLDQQTLSDKAHITFLEKTPKNALRIEFLNAAFPNARFIYLFRQPHSNISSIIDGWKSGRFVTYHNLKGWHGEYPWSFLLPNGWRDLPPNDLATIANYQYRESNQSIINSLTKLEKHQTLALRYEAFIENPRACLQNICGFLALPWSNNFDLAINASGGLALSKYTLEAPSEDKWQRNQTLLAPILKNAQDFYRNEIVPTAKLINC